MTPQEKQLARVMFKSRISLANGTAYESLFGQVMDYARPGFLKIKPYGNEGDRGNDGYEKKHGRYFQVFAPENPSVSIKKAIQKVLNDFQDKLLPYWSSYCEIKEFYFAFNDKYLGSTRDIETTLEQIKTTYKLIDACIYLAKHLEDECLNLKEDQLLTIVGGIPHLDSSTQIDFSILGEVINHIQKTPPDVLNRSVLVAPDIDKKIEFNDLITCGPWLRSKQLETWQVDDFFSHNSEFAKQALREHLAGYYAESLIKLPDSCSEKNENTIGDLRFAFILDKIAPITNNPAHDRLKREAALIIMAKYFETCDIFEEPK